MAVLGLFSRKTILVLLGSVLLLIAVQTNSAQAACSAQPTTYGSSTMTVNVPNAGTYRVWSRIMAPNTTANSYILEVDDTTCNIVVGDSAIAANTWTWVDYKSATTTNKVSLTLTAGQHTFKMIGREANVKLDRIILTADTTCVPTGTGENCANPPDTTPPVVALSSPAAGATVSGPTAIRATASDDVAVSKVEFYVNSTLRGADTSAATGGVYEVTFDMSSLAPGQHTIYARAYDTSSSGNPVSSSIRSVTVADKTPPTVTLTTPTAGATVSGTSTFSANATDNVGVTKVEFLVDGAVVATDTASPYTVSVDTKLFTNGAHTVIARASDAGGNTTPTAGVNITVSNITVPVDTTPPTVSITNPASSATISGTAAFSANATDNVGVTKVEFLVDGALKSTDTTAPYDYSLNTSTLTNAAHNLTVKAYDAAGNMQTNSVSVTVSNVTYLREDINSDGTVNIQDFSLLAAKFGQTGSNLGREDINSDGTVNIQDFSLLAAKFGA